jgi:EpsI family protein
MLMTAGLAVAMKPTTKVGDSGARIDLETMIPNQFGDWREDTSISVRIVNPEQQVRLSKIYNQTLSRTYVSRGGEHIMLSIAYGGDQSDAMQVHKPEVCYPAQGFVLWKAVVGALATQYGALPVKRLITSLGNRREPITYWVTVGDRAVRAGLPQKLAQLAYGLTGKIPDGILVRVSSIDSDDARAYQTQEEFIRSMLASMKADDRIRVAGRFGA